MLAALLFSQGLNLYLSFAITILAGALIGVFNAFMAVSYTHLDVYKRQVRGRRSHP